MLTQKFMEYAKRQNVLAAKAAEGKATEGEIAELKKISTALSAAMGDHEPQCETELASLNAEEFKKYVQDETAAVEVELDPDRLSLLKRNIADVKRQQAKGAETFAVYMAVVKEEADAVSALEARIAALEAGSVVAPEKAEEDETEKGVAQDLGAEALDALLLKFNLLKTKMDAGGVSIEDVDAAFNGNWQLRDFIEMAAAFMTKSDEMAKTIAPIVDALTALAGEEKAEETPEGEKVDESEEEKTDEKAEESEEEKTDEDNDEDTETATDKPVDWNDLSVEAASGQDDVDSTYKALKTACGEHRE